MTGKKHGESTLGDGTHGQTDRSFQRCRCIKYNSASDTRLHVEKRNGGSGNVSLFNHDCEEIDTVDIEAGHIDDEDNNNQSYLTAKQASQSHSPV